MYATLHELTRPHKTLITRDDGTRNYATIPSLLAQLREAIDGFRPGGRNGRTLHSAPVNIEALGLYQSIARHAQDLKTTEARHAPVTGSLESIITAWATTTTNQDRARIILDNWAGRIRTLLDPPRRFEINTTCPECGARQVITTEGVINLAISYRDGVAQCAACLTTWVGAQLHDLARHHKNERMRAIMSSLDIELHISGKPVTIGASLRVSKTSADLGMLLTTLPYRTDRRPRGELTTIHRPSERLR